MAAKGNPKAEAETTEEMSEQAKAIQRILDADATSLRPFQKAVLEMLHGLEEIATEDTEGRGFTGDDIGAILLADDEATMWEADELPRLNAKVLSGCQLDVYGYSVKFSNDSEISSGLIAPRSRRKMYLLVQSARLNSAGESKLYHLPDVGEEFAWNTSARFIVAKLYWFGKRGRFDNGGSVKARIHGTPLAGGKSVEKLKEIEGVTLIDSSAVPF